MINANTSYLGKHKANSSSQIINNYPPRPTTGKISGIRSIPVGSPKRNSITD